MVGMPALANEHREARPHQNFDGARRTAMVGSLYIVRFGYLDFDFVIGVPSACPPKCVQGTVLLD